MSWVVELAEKGNSFLNSFDSQVAGLLNQTDTNSTHPQKDGFLEAISTLRVGPLPRTHTALSEFDTSARKTPQNCTKSQVSIAYSDAALFEFLNNPTPVNQLMPTLVSTGQRMETAQNTTGMSSDVVNRLLNMEIASLSQEITALLERNRRAESETQRLRTQAESLRAQLSTAERRLLQLEETGLERGETLASVEQEVQLQKRTDAMEDIKNKLLDMESQLRETRKQDELRRDLAEYKETSTKEKVQRMSHPRFQTGSTACSFPNSSQSDDLSSELDFMREESFRLRAELEDRNLAIHEADHELDLLRKTIHLLEMQIVREQQVRAVAEGETEDLRQKLLSFAEQSSLERTQLQARELEITRVRPLEAERLPCPSVSNEQYFNLDTRLQQLTDTLITKQDALEATLAQNLTLKIRLEKYESEQEVLLLNSNSFKGIGYLPQSRNTLTGFTRLHLLNKPIPRLARSAIGCLDILSIRLVKFLRQRPIPRMFFLVYLLIAHFWCLIVFILFSPIPSP